jgi:hypothetical protein
MQRKREQGHPFQAETRYYVQTQTASSSPSDATAVRPLLALCSGPVNICQSNCHAQYVRQQTGTAEGNGLFVNRRSFAKKAIAAVLHSMASK